MSSYTLPDGTKMVRIAEHQYINEHAARVLQLLPEEPGAAHAGNITRPRAKSHGRGPRPV